MSYLFLYAAVLCVYTHSTGCRLTFVWQVEDIKHLSYFFCQSKCGHFRRSKHLEEPLKKKKKSLVLNKWSATSTAADVHHHDFAIGNEWENDYADFSKHGSFGKEQMDCVVNRNVSLYRPDGRHRSCLCYILLVLTEKYQKFFEYKQIGTYCNWGFEEAFPG